jgi:hypothetical protein
VVSQAGAVVLVETARASGIAGSLSAGLGPWRKPLAVHDPAKVILDLAIGLVIGGDCLADIALARAEPSVFGPVASDPTVSRTIDALAEDAPRALAAIDAARAGTWKRFGCGLRWRGTPVPPQECGEARGLLPCTLLAQTQDVAFKCTPSPRQYPSAWRRPLSPPLSRIQ